MKLKNTKHKCDNSYEQYTTQISENSIVNRLHGIYTMFKQSTFQCLLYKLSPSVSLKIATWNLFTKQVPYKALKVA